MSKTYRIKWNEGEATLHHDRGITTQGTHTVRETIKDFNKLIRLLRKLPYYSVTEI